MKKKSIVMVCLSIGSLLFGSLETLKEDFAIAIQNVENVDVLEKERAKNAIQSLSDVRHEALNAIANKEIAESKIKNELTKSNRLILKKMAQLAGFKKPKKFKKRLDLKGFKDLDKAGKVQMLIDQANKLLDMEIAKAGWRNLVSMFNLKEEIMLFENNNKDFLQDHPEISHELNALRERISSALVGEDSQEKKPTPPPLPPRDRDTQGVPISPLLPSQPSDLLEEIRQGKELKPITEQPIEKEKDLLQEIREGVKLKPVSERELSERQKTEKEEYLESIEKGIKLKPAQERQLPKEPKAPREKTEREKLREEIRDGIKLKPITKKDESLIPAQQETDLASEIARRREALREDSEYDEGYEGDDKGDIDYGKERLDEQEDKTIPTPPPLPPRAPVKEAKELIKEPVKKPSNDRGALLEQIRGGTELKKTTPRGPKKEETPGALSSFEKAVLEQKKQLEQTETELEDSDYEEGDWD